MWYYFLGGMVIGGLVGLIMDSSFKSLCTIILLAILWALLGIKIEQ